MAKMYYSEQEAAQKLGCSVSDLDRFVRDQQLRVYRDGAKKMYKASEVDAMSGEGGEEISLAPADGADAVRLTDTDTPRVATKEDTVISAEGISIFDDEDLEIEAADPMAKTQISAAIEDQVAIEGVGSGSGLLDLTRESDDTSLGAEVLDHIDMEGAAPAGVDAGGAYGAAHEILVPAQTVEETDPQSGLFGGLTTGLAVVMLAMVIVAVAAVTGIVPEMVADMAANGVGVLVGVVVLCIIGAVVGWFVGKSAMERQAALKKVE
jgi:hypothetical protein